MLRIDYIEFPTQDMAASKAFYQKAFGWTFEDWGPNYASFNDGRISGGLEVRPEPPPGTGTLVILYAEDLEQALKAVESAGGTITKPIFGFPGGRRFECADPSGNPLGVWSDTGVEAARPPGS